MNIINKRGMYRNNHLIFGLSHRLAHLFTALSQKRIHSRYNFGYGILLYIRKMPYFRPFIAHFGGFESVFSFVTDKSTILCLGKTETADFVSFKGSIVQEIKIYKKMLFYEEKSDTINYSSEIVMKEICGNGNN